jgi:hypothetical protein
MQADANLKAVNTDNNCHLPAVVVFFVFFFAPGPLCFLVYVETKRARTSCDSMNETAILESVSFSGSVAGVFSTRSRFL